MTIAAAPKLRERTAFEIIDVSIQLFRRHYATFVMLTMLAAFPYWIVLWMSGFMSVLAGVRPVGPDLGLNSSTFALFPLTWLWEVVFAGAVIVAASDAYLNGTVDPARALRTALGKTWQMISSVIALICMCAVIAVPTLTIGVYYLFLRYFAILPVILLENEGVTNAFHRSRDLSQGFKWRIFGTLLLSYLIVLVVIIGLQVVMAFLPVAPLGRQIVNAAVGTFVAPVITIAWTVLYYDQRVRKDGFDLEVMTRDLTPAPAAG